MKKVLISVLSSLLATSLVGCGSGSSSAAAESTTAESPEISEASESSDPVEITFWHSYSEGEEKIFTDTVLKKFEEEHPEIKVNAIRMPYEGMDEQLVTAVTGDAAPDVMRMDLTWVPQMAELGCLESLNGYDGFDELTADIVKGSMDTTLYDGKNYGVPLNANTTVAVYNKQTLQDLGFDTPPETLDELLAAADQTDPSNEKYLFAVSGTYNWAMLPFIWTLGGSITDPNYTTATGYLNSEATVNALDTINQWYQNGIIGPAIMGEQPDAWGGLEAGNYSMIVEGPWFFSSNENTETYEPALIPSVDGRSISIVGGEDIVITSTSKKKDAAWTFIQFMLQDDQQIAMSKAGMIPVTSTAMSKVDTSESPYVEVYMKQLETAQARIPSANWPDIQAALDAAFESVFRGTATAQDALDEAAATIDQLLAE